MIHISVKAKGEAKHEGKVLDTFEVEREVNVPTSISEAAEMFGDKQALDYLKRAYIIEMQASMRSEETARILEEHGIAKRAALSPEVKAIVNKLKSLPAEKLEKLLASL